MTKLNKNQVDAVNRIISEYMGRCYHESALAERLHHDFSTWTSTQCDKCREIVSASDCLDYTSQDSPRRLLAEVEGKVIAEFGDVKYVYAIDLSIQWDRSVDLLTATAEERAIAIVRTIGRWSEVEALADKGE